MAERLFDEAFLRRLDSISLRFDEALNGTFSGGRRSRQHGSTVEYSGFRDYVQGDDFRRIDWNAYGRFEKFFIRLFLDERQLETRIFVDVSGSMDSGTPSKMITALRTAAAIAYVSASAQDRVSIITLSGGKAEELVTGMNGRQGFYSSLERIEGVASGGTTDLCASLKDYRGFTGGTGAAVLITDLMTGEGWRDALKYLLYRKQQVFLIQILSPEETDPRLDGAVRLTDSEDGSFCDIANAPAAVEYYRRALADYCDEISSFCLRSGIRYLRAGSDEDESEIIFGKGTAAGIFA